MSGEERVTSEVRSSELETRLSSSDDLVEVERDTTASVPSSSLSPHWREIRAFHALKEE